VDDLVEGMVRMMENSGGFVGPVNLGNPGEFSIRQLAEKVLVLIPQSSSRIVSMPLPADDPRQRRPDISLAYKELGWQPGIPLEQGLARTIDYFRQSLSATTVQAIAD
jgi:UDP-glucuronate decarboxylase